MKMTKCMEMRGYISIFFSKTYVNVNLFIFKWNMYKFTRTQCIKKQKSTKIMTIYWKVLSFKFLDIFSAF